jgi:hypothetical protein
MWLALNASSTAGESKDEPVTNYGMIYSYLIPAGGRVAHTNFLKSKQLNTEGAPSFDLFYRRVGDRGPHPSDGMIYYYYVPNGGYAPNGNILAHSDMVMGDWIFTYDAVDRLSSAIQAASAATSTQYAGKVGCWTYDAYGNRLMEAFSTAACNNNSTPQVLTTYNSANNQVVNSTVSPNTITGVGTFVYDASGNTLYDGNNRYWYDAEGQLCAVQNQRSSGAPVIQYVYDAEGARIAKGTLAAAPSSYTATCAPPLGTGFTLNSRYLVDQGGDQVTEWSARSFVPVSLLV